MNNTGNVSSVVTTIFQIRYEIPFSDMSYISELRKDINIRSKAGQSYNFSPEDLSLVVADVDF